MFASRETMTPPQECISPDLLFARRVEQWVLEAVSAGKTEFDNLLLALPGVYPVTALHALHRLVSSRKVHPHVLNRAYTAVRQPRVPSVEGQSRHPCALPRPHPLDFAWRFSPVATARLLDECTRLSRAGETVALVGVPTMLCAARRQGFPRRFLLLERSLSVLDHVARYALSDDLLFQCDVHRDPLPGVMAPIVIVDPPWYAEDVRAFLWAASQVCQIGGYVLMSAAPLGTRPGIDQERASLIAWARSVGLNLVRIVTGALPYISPLFERNALAAEGVYSLPAQWRHGDLAVFARVNAMPAPRPPEPAQGDVWMEEVVDGVHFRIKCREAGRYEGPSLESIVPGNILPSVSRRDHRRPWVDVWTSGNRVFRCASPCTLAHIVRATATGRTVCEELAQEYGRHLSEHEATCVIRIEHQVRQIVTREHEEAMRIGEE